MLIEKKNTAELLPADYNPRKDLKPGDPEYDKLKRSIEQFGYVEPVIWNQVTGCVVGGHQRLKVLIDMGITEVECVVVERAFHAVIEHVIPQNFSSPARTRSISVSVPASSNV